MSDPTLLSFRYRLEQQPPHSSCGGVVRGASVRQFPVSQGIGGASMRLQPRKRFLRRGCLSHTPQMHDDNRCSSTKLLPTTSTSSTLRRKMGRPSRSRSAPRNT